MEERGVSRPHASRVEARTRRDERSARGGGASIFLVPTSTPEIARPHEQSLAGFYKVNARKADQRNKRGVPPSPRPTRRSIIRRRAAPSTKQKVGPVEGRAPLDEEGSLASGAGRSGGQISPLRPSDRLGRRRSRPTPAEAAVRADRQRAKAPPPRRAKHGAPSSQQLSDGQRTAAA